MTLSIYIVRGKLGAVHLASFYAFLFYAFFFLPMTSRANTTEVTSTRRETFRPSLLARKKPDEATLYKNDKRILYVGTPVGRLYTAPDDKSSVIAKLRINTALRGLLHKKQKHVVMQKGKWIKVEAYPPQGRVAGFIHATDVVQTPKSAPSHLQDVKALQKTRSSVRAETWAEKKAIRKVKKSLQQACAANPSSLEAIEGYADFLAQHGGQKKGSKAETMLYYVRKGWLAARRRALHWDGPLYPIVDGYAYMSAPCDERAHANGSRRSIPNLELRARAFPFFSSGKSVSVSEGGYKTQKLKSPSCKENQLVYQVKGAKNGTLLSSWRVAGFKVLPFVEVKGGKESPKETRHFQAGRIHIAARPSGFILEEQNLEGTRKSKEHGFPHAPSSLASSNRPVPVAWFSEAEQQEIVVLFSHDTESRCASGRSVRQWLMRFIRSVDGSLVVETGRVYSASTDEKCAATQFSPLPHEPRSIEKDVLLSAGWKQESP